MHAGVLMKLGAYGVVRVGFQMLPDAAADLVRAPLGFSASDEGDLPQHDPGEDDEGAHQVQGDEDPDEGVGIHG